MTYPTLEQVRVATMFELGNWYRNLPSPTTPEQVQVMNSINQRFVVEGGGFTPELSKSVGWGPKRFIQD